MSHVGVAKLDAPEEMAVWIPIPDQFDTVDAFVGSAVVGTAAYYWLGPLLRRVAYFMCRRKLS